jgi:hypothetical protein
MKEKRKRIWIDRFQTYLSIRLALYFILYQAIIWMITVVERNVTAVVDQRQGPAAAALLRSMLLVFGILLGLLFIFDSVRLTHRVVGPLHRFRKTIQALKAGEAVPLLALREGDFLQEMKDDLNDLLRMLEERGAIEIKPADSKVEPQQKEVAAL